ncbi:hypothetical protein ACIA5D_31790 [Actinoplanes sp. NPDC051513]|uniref:hypothetical protein n=1 Tax=Actinoplanes sp. NPDC051513 TaxID=3363908 RepID=UPI00379BCE9E
MSGFIKRFIYSMLAQKMQRMSHRRGHPGRPYGYHGHYKHHGHYRYHGHYRHHGHYRRRRW